MRRLEDALNRRLQEETGQALAEYAMIVAFIALVCVFALTALGVAIGVPFSDIVGRGFASGS